MDSRIAATPAIASTTIETPPAYNPVGVRPALLPTPTPAGQQLDPGKAGTPMTQAARVGRYQELHGLFASGRVERLVEGVGELNNDWLRLNVTAAVALRELQNVESTQQRKLELNAQQALVAHGLDTADARKLIERLIEINVLARVPGGRRLRLATTAEAVATKMSDTYFFVAALEKALAAVRVDGTSPVVRELVERAAEASEAWPSYQVESRWPFLKAAALLKSEDQDLLIQQLSVDPVLKKRPLPDSTLLMLRGAPQSSWIATHAPHLVGSVVYTIAAEGWFVAGGLGRVQQYHSVGMRELGAQVATVEPYYSLKSNGEPIDYARLPTPVQNLAKIGEAQVRVNHRPATVELFKGTNRFGIDVYLVRDAADACTRAIYAYGRHGTSSWEDFTEFMSRGSLELLYNREHVRKDGEPSYRPAAFIVNDGQVLPLISFYQTHGAPLSGAVPFPVTHTYKNRGVFTGAAGHALLERWEIPLERRRDFWRINEADASSGGIRSAGYGAAVSAVHRDEVASIDPTAKLVAITNGDNRGTSSAVFRLILQEVAPGANPDAPTPEQIVKVKRVAKARLGLNPDQPVISYSGRFVPEKSGRERAFTDDNIRALVAQGAQVVLYTNVQASEESQKGFAKLKALEEELTRGGGPGRLVCRTGWGLDDQIQLLAAIDIQVQDSDRGTGAAEYTESDVSANGGLQMGPPWLEGIIQRQGIPIDRMQRYHGNTLVPKDASPAAYLDALSWAIDLYYEDPRELATYQVTSVRVSRVHEAKLTSAEYLREINAKLAAQASKANGDKFK